MANNQMRNRFLVGAIMVPLFIIPIYFGGWVLVLGLLYLLVAGLHEYYSVVGERRTLYSYVGDLIGVAIILVGYLIPAKMDIAIVVAALAFVPLKLLDSEFQFNRWIRVFLAALYLGLFLSFAISIRQLPNGMAWLLTVLAGGSATDVFSYFVGIKFGRTKLAPRTSPGKTWEGFAGGLIAAVLVVTALCQIFQLTSIYLSILLGVIVAFADLLGDLFESMIKRTFGVKDFGAWMMKDAHGGVLDRIDGWLVVLPVTYLVIKYIFFG